MANRGIMDVGLQLRDVADANETADADEAGVALDFAPNHPDGAEDNTGIDYRFKAVFHNITIGGDVAPTQVDFVIDVDSLAAFSDTPVEVARRTWVSGTELEIILDQNDIVKLDPNAAAIRCGMDLTGGTNPTVDYGCYLTKV